MPSVEATLMSEIVAAAVPTLREAGFRKRRHSFNRTTTSGLVHVVHFWMAPKEPPAWTEVPGLRERRYGSFRLDFGVWIPEITRGKQPPGSWINEYNCDLRTDIGRLLSGDYVDFWWKLKDPEAKSHAMSALINHGLPWLSQFPAQSAVLAAFHQRGPLSIGLSPAGPLDIAEMYQSMGRPQLARQILEDYVSKPVVGGHLHYLSEYLPAIGHPDLVDRLQAKAFSDPQ